MPSDFACYGYWGYVENNPMNKLFIDLFLFFDTSGIGRGKIRTHDLRCGASELKRFTPFFSSIIIGPNISEIDHGLKI